MDPLELAAILFALLAFCVAAIAARGRSANIGWWTWAWALLVVAGMAMELGGERSVLLASGAFMAVVFPGMQLAGTFEYTDRSVPRWLIPAFLVLGAIRLAVAGAGFEAQSHMAVVPFEIAALLAGAAVIVRSRSDVGFSPIESMIIVGFVVIAAAEAIDAFLDLRGAGIAWPVWLVIGLPVGSCQVLATFDRMQRRLSVSLAEREQALQAVEESNDRFRAIAEEAGDVIVEASSVGGILYANPRSFEVLGYAPEEVLGHRLGEFVWDEKDFPTRSDLVVHRGRLFGPFRVRHRDGSSRWMEISTTSYVRGEQVHRVVIARDVTERLRSEEERRKAQKLESLGLMAGGIAHDFNNLLVGILGNTDLAQAELPAGHPAAGFLKLSIEASEQAVNLTRQLQAYAGASPFELHPIDLSEEIRSRADLLRTAAGEHVTLEFALEPGLPAVDADPGLLFQAVLNLVVNAAEASAEGVGCVKISTGLTQIVESDPAPISGRLRPGYHAFVEVEDNGHGIDESTCDRIFDPFFTTHATGRGLGLAVVHGVVKTLRGGLSVDSAPDRGSRFRLLLRLAAAPSPQHSAPERRSLEGSESLLVVDDNASVRAVMSAALERSGYEVWCASGGRQAREIVASRPIQLVLLDAVMPGESVEQILEDLRVLRPDVPVLVVSGYAESEAMRQFVKGGRVSGFLAKPFTREVLATRVRELLDGAGSPAHLP